jgi:hypothetical protein
LHEIVEFRSGGDVHYSTVSTITKLVNAPEGLADGVNELIFAGKRGAAGRADVEVAQQGHHLFRRQTSQGEALEQLLGGVLFLFHL